jgi:LuxR family transcriptional regulator, maltose regulon positive regulatory protein
MAMQGRLTVVSGPPGSGKSVLLADWAQNRANGLVAWLTLDENDNDPGRFWQHLAAAIGLACPYPSAKEDTDRLVDLMVEGLGGDGPRVVIIDDFHVLTDAVVVGSVVRLARHLPPQARFILAGQSTPGFPLKRLLLSGEAASVGEADLRFTIEEAAALIALVGRRVMPVDELRVLTERSAGWVPALRLAAEALRDQDDPSDFVRRFSGGFPPVAEYLQSEMLWHQPPDVVRFLLQTSVLEDLTADTCRAVTGRTDSAEILESLAGRNLFVLRPESAEHAYRYHPLLADLLRSRLQFEDTSLIREAHLNAAKCFERQGDVRSAAYHLAQAGVYDRAFALVFSNLVGASGDRPAAERQLCAESEMPEPDEDEDPGRMYMRAAALLSVLRVTEAGRLLRRLDGQIGQDSGGALWRGRIEFLWAVHAERLADAPGILDHCRATSELMGSRAVVEGGKVAQPDRVRDAWPEALDEAILAHLPVLAARAHIWLGQSGQARAILTDHFTTEERAQAAEPAMMALVACRQGQLRDAYRLATGALEARSGQDGGNELRGLEARLALAEVLFEHNELAAAREHLEEALRLCRSKADRSWAWAVEIDLIRVMIAEQHAEDVLSRLGRLRQLEMRSPPPSHLLQRLNQLEIGCRIATGDLGGAVVVARSIPPGEISSDALARIDLCSGRPDRALARLTASASPATGMEIRRLVLLACAEVQRGHVPRAEDYVRRALDAGKREGYVRPFLEEALQILPLLRAIGSSRQDPYLTQLITEAELIGPCLEPRTSGTILEPLTDRERQVLGYLSSHLHQRDIAATMYVSLNTVKTHVKAIYRKVGAASRTEAVAIARSHGLL